VFERKDWEQLLGRSIVPKLAFALQELVINPLHQELEPFQWVLSWQDVMPLSQVRRQVQAEQHSAGVQTAASVLEAGLHNRATPGLYHQPT
jgi:hypothetical protein